MAFSEIYRNQVALLIRTLPLIAPEDCFALKGGTAINLFVRDMPRLSVDIDLTYLPVLPRDESLKAIDDAMNRIAERIHGAIRNAEITKVALRPEEIVTKLLVRADGVQIEIEVTPVLRGLYTNQTCAQSLPPWKRRSVLLKCASCPLLTSMLGRSSPPLTVNILATSLTCEIFWPTRASTKHCVAPSSAIFSATTGQSPRC